MRWLHRQNGCGNSSDGFSDDLQHFSDQRVHEKCPFLQRIMRPVTERRSAGSLAAAKVKGSVFIRFVSDRGELRIAMRAITEGLVLALSTRAPKVLFALRHVDRERCFLCDIGFGHGLLLVLLR